MEAQQERGEPQVDRDFWAGKRVFLTGHTGFKGSWLAIWLAKLGAEIFGYALAPEHSQDMFAVLDLPNRLGGKLHHGIGDVRDLTAVSKAIRDARPHIVIHMAAQPLVRRSYREPVETYATNVMGTVHVLEASRSAPTVQAIVVVTTDKCYENREHDVPYVETDHLGGHDPYSSSKAAAEIAASAYRRSFFAEGGPALATGRAGNVIGGGDWSEDRLIPDAIRAWQSGSELIIRSPNATRPWQHVVEPLRGYLLLAQKLVREGQPFAEAWNFGPELEAVQTVGHVVEKIANFWGNRALWRAEANSTQLHEAQKLQLDCRKAAEQLGWRPKIPLDTALHLTAEWYQLSASAVPADALFELTNKQIGEHG